MAKQTINRITGKRVKPKPEGKQKHDYTPKEKENAVALVFKHGHYSTVHRLTGIAVATLRGWVNSMNDDEHQEVRSAIIEEVIQGAWKGVFNSLVIAQEAINGYKLPKDPSMDQIAKIAETAERVSRILKNVGAIQEKLQIGFDPDASPRIEMHFHAPDGVTGKGKNPFSPA